MSEDNDQQEDQERENPGQEQEPVTSAETENAEIEKKPAQGPVPYERFNAVNKAKKQAEAELAAVRKELEGLQNANKSDIEKAIERAAKAEQQIADLEADIALNKRNQTIIEAARKCGWANPLVAKDMIHHTEIDAENSNIEDLVNTYTDRNPWVKGSVKPVTANQGAGGGTGMQVDPDTLGKMSMDEYERYRSGGGTK